MNNPYFNSNKRGIPTVAVTSVSTSGTQTTLTLPDGTFMGKWYQGIIFLEIGQDITAETSSNTLNIGVNGEQRPLLLATGDTATVADIAGCGAVFQVYYDKPRNYLQLMTTVPGTTITEISSAGSGKPTT